jgi:hypothetical protein
LNSSCSPVIQRGFTKHSCRELTIIPVFPDEFEKALYKVEIALNKKNLTGLAMIKKMKETNSFRMVFMSETGLKYFDFEFINNDSFQQHYVMEALNRKGLIRTLTTDLGLLISSKGKGKVLKCYHSENPSEGLIIKEKHRGRNHYYFKDRNGGPNKIYRKACFSPATTVEIKYDSKRIPSNIIFTHGIINFKLELKLLTE